MSDIFDTTIKLADLGVAGHEDHVELQYVLGLLTPISPTQAINIPAGMIRVPMDRKTALAHAALIIEEAEKIEETPEPSGLVIADNLNGIDEAQAFEESLRNGGS